MNGEQWLSKKATALRQGMIRAMFDKARTMKNVISMGIGEPDLDTPAPIIAACNEALEKGFPWLHFNFDWEDDYIRKHEKSNFFRNKI